jgi:alkanesulfonate monooxygenase SsuD/methylene tetrahydromethanopterin reductase-like flavin-dependent oxidoreductase (luciferase family)/predicted kinase
VEADGAAIPDPALVVLIGPSGAGKSTWAAARYRSSEIVSSDQLRAVAGRGEHDLDASADAFALLDQIVTARARRGLTVVIDTLGLDQARRLGYLALARRHGLPAVVVVFGASAALCRDRNRSRDVPVPAAVLTAQFRRMPEARGQLAAEGWDLVLAAGDSERGAGRASGVALRGGDGQRPAGRSGPAPADQTAGIRAPGGRLEFILQLSSFGWSDDPAGWLKGMALAAAEAGFAGIALMDHLLQIPQVGRAWDPIPEPWVTLGLLAGLDLGLRLGTLVSPVTFRPPGITAKAAATLDVLSGGQAFCGIGAGWWDREHAAFGLPFPPAARRLDLLESAIETMRALWQPGTKPYSGERVQLPETTCYPRPVSPIPIIVGGNGERRTLAIAARLGDGCNLPSDPAVLEVKLAALRAHCQRAGRDPAEVAVTVLDIPVIGGDREQVARIAEKLRGRTGAAAFARRHHPGLPADHAARYADLATRGVQTVFVALPDLTGPEDLSRMAPVISQI